MLRMSKCATLLIAIGIISGCDGNRAEDTSQEEWLGVSHTDNDAYEIEFEASTGIISIKVHNVGASGDICINSQLWADDALYGDFLRVEDQAGRVAPYSGVTLSVFGGVEVRIPPNGSMTAAYSLSEYYGLYGMQPPYEIEAGYPFYDCRPGVLQSDRATVPAEVPGDTIQRRPG